MLSRTRESGIETPVYIRKWWLKQSREAVKVECKKENAISRGLGRVSSGELLTATNADQ